MCSLVPGVPVHAAPHRVVRRDGDRRLRRHLWAAPGGGRRLLAESPGEATDVGSAGPADRRRAGLSPCPAMERRWAPAAASEPRRTSPPLPPLQSAAAPLHRSPPATAGSGALTPSGTSLVPTATTLARAWPSMAPWRRTSALPSAASSPAPVSPRSPSARLHSASAPTRRCSAWCARCCWRRCPTPRPTSSCGCSASTPTRAGARQPLAGRLPRPRPRHADLRADGGPRLPRLGDDQPATSRRRRTRRAWCGSPRACSRRLASSRRWAACSRADEDLPNAPRVALISDGFWRRRFAADPGVVGGVMRVERRAVHA